MEGSREAGGLLPEAETVAPPAPAPGEGGASGRVYFPELDGLRAVAIGLVYVFHDRGLDLLGAVAGTIGVALALTVDPLLGLAGLGSVGFRMPSLVHPLRENGWIGVQIFFVLSGYLIATLLLRERERYGRVDLRAFWVRRALRIWPLYYLMIFICWGVMPLARTLVGLEPRMWRGEGPVQLPAFLAFAGNWSMGLRGPVPSDSAGVLWSLCVEEQFYLFVPLLIAWAGPGARAAWAAALMLGGIVARYAMADAGVGGLLLRFNTLVHLDTLLAGVLLAMATRRSGAIGRAPSWLLRALVLAGAAVVLTTPLARGGPWRQAIDYVFVWGWGVALVAWAASAKDPWTAALRRPALVWLGRISFGLYVYHEIALGIAGWVADLACGLPLVSGLMPMAAPALTVGLAALSYSRFERPFLRLKGRWTRVPSRPDDGEGGGGAAPRPGPVT